MEDSKDLLEDCDLQECVIGMHGSQPFYRITGNTIY